MTSLFRIRRLRDGKRYSTRTSWSFRAWNKEGKFLTLRALSQVPSRIRDAPGVVIEVWQAELGDDVKGYANVRKRWRKR